MKKEYIKPEIEIIKFQAEDIITTSSLGEFTLPGDSKLPWDEL